MRLDHPAVTAAQKRSLSAGRASTIHYSVIRLLGTEERDGGRHLHDRLPDDSGNAPRPAQGEGPHRADDELHANGRNHRIEVAGRDATGAEAELHRVGGICLTTRLARDRPVSRR